MLVLSRHLQERIVLPGLGITVQVVAISPGVVRLGIEAPPLVDIVREELLGRFAAPANRLKVGP
jgi:carbon storage regulator CsrA